MSHDIGQQSVDPSSTAPSTSKGQLLSVSENSTAGMSSFTQLSWLEGAMLR
jgi:hypothetical protein